MCVIDRYTLVYSPGIRKPKDKITSCRYSVHGQPCSKAFIRDLGEYPVQPRSRSEGAYCRPSTYRIIEPGEYTKPAKKAEERETRHRPKRRTINLDSLGIRIPWGKRSVRKESERIEERVTRGRTRQNREANPFIVDPPEHRPCRSRSRTELHYRQPVQEIRPKSPRSRAKPSNPPVPPPPPPPEPPRSSRSTSSLQRRPPRERTPVSDRVSLRQSQASSSTKSPVVIHHNNGDESPPLTPTREHRRQRGLGNSPQKDTIRHIHRNRDLRHQAQEDARDRPEKKPHHGYRASVEEDTRQAAWAARDRNYARHCQDERPLRSFAERQRDQIDQRGRDRYGAPIVLQETGGGRRIHRERERIYESEVRKPAHNRYGFPLDMFDRFKPRQEYRDCEPREPLPRRSSMPYGQKIVFDDDSLRSGWRWR